MWIRRSFGDDALYTTLVQAYLDTLLQEGHNFECFVGMYHLTISDVHYLHIYRGRSITHGKAFATKVWYLEFSARKCAVWSGRRRRNLSREHTVRQGHRSRVRTVITHSSKVEY